MLLKKNYIREKKMYFSKRLVFTPMNLKHCRKHCRKWNICFIQVYYYLFLLREIFILVFEGLNIFFIPINTPIFHFSLSKNFFDF